MVLMTLASGAAFAQGFNTTNWKFSNPKQFGFTVLDVDYFDNNNAIAVGEQGGIARSTDGGRNWTYGVFTYLTPASLLAKPTFNDVHFVTASVAYAVANGGVMAKTTDGGATWSFLNNPLFPSQVNINACWFLNANKGYIGGDYNNTPDSLPKLYVTLNGGATWDSIAAPPANGVSRVGYINNPSIPSVLRPVDAKLKSIYRIEFINDSTGYICGSNSYGVTLFPNVSFRATSTTVCTPLTTFLTSGSMAASLLWKFKSGVLTDYSISKERIGYTGINTNTINCTSAYASVSPVTQTYRAMNIINDSTVVIMSFNNNTVVKVNTGKNDSTANVNASGVFEKGKYEVLNFPSPPTQGPNAGPSIPNPQVLLASNPYQMRRTSNGTLLVAGNFGRMFKSVDTGRNWIQDVSLPQGQNYSGNGVWAFDIAPNGRVLSMGTAGVMADSLPGSSWQSNHVAVPIAGGYSDMEFVDCNNGIAAGGANITVTNDGGATWIDRQSAVLAALNASITHLSYVNPTKVYFTTSIGNIYRSANQGVNLSPVFSEPLGGTVNDIAWQGADSLWACGYSSFSVPTASRQGKVYRSFNNGATWDTIGIGPVGSLSVTPRAIDFPTRSVGYVIGTRNAVYKTIDAGATWTDVSPFPALTPQLGYTAIQALNKDTVFVIGVGFPRKAVYRTTDGGATWTDITGNILTTGVGNLNGILMHDINNGYVMTPGGALLVTNNGGTSWTLDLAPTSNLFTTAAFVPRAVGAGVNMVNRKMLVSGPNLPNGGAPILEYGNPANTQVNSTELIAGAACSSPNSGSITITATGGLAPYTYKLDAGAFQPSNVFTGVSAGTHTITIKDAYCGLLTKTVTVALNDDQVLNTNITSTTVCAGVPVQLIASGNSTSYSWSPALGLSNPNIANPIATPLVTTTYTVTATLNSCVKTRSITINVNPNPNLIIVADPGTTVCEGDPTLLTVYDAGAISAPGTLYTQGTTPVNGSPSQVFEPANTAFNSQSADDFIVPNGNIWNVSSITANGIGTGVPTSVNVFFYANSGSNLPGAAIASFNNISTFTQAGSNYTVTLPSAVVLGSGRYWVSFQVNMSFATGGQWFWGNYGAPTVNSEYAWQNPGGGFATPCTNWGYGGTGCNVGGGAANVNNIFSLVGTSVGLGPQSTGTFLWSPAAGLSSTTSNPVAASPQNTTTYTVTRTTGPGCVASAQVTITVNKRPVVTTQPVSRTNCSGTSASFTVAGTGTNLTYQWQVSTTGCAGPWVNLTNTAPYSNVTTATLTVNPVTTAMTGYAYRCVLGGTCAPFTPATNVSSCAILTVNPLPVVTVTPTISCAGGNGPCNPLTASGADTYTWSPTTGLYLNCTATVPYTGGNAVTVYANPTVFTAYTVTGTITATGCSNTAVALVNYTPPAPTVVPSSVTMCLGDPAVKLKSSSATTTTVAFNSGTIAVAIPDNSQAGASHNITVSGIPANATVTGMRVKMTIPHTFIGDLVIALKAPNNNVLNLDFYLSNTFGGVTTGFSNTIFTSAAGAPAVSTGTNPYSSSFRADGQIAATGNGPAAPTGYTANMANYAALISSLTPANVNGAYTLAMYDGGAIDVGTLTNWEIEFTYIQGIPATPAVWTPAAGLFSDANASVPYVAGTAVDSVWTKPTPSGVYTYQATVQSLPVPPATVATPMAGGNGNNLVAFNVRNNNAYPVTFSSISSNAFGSGAVVSRVFYKPSAIAGNPGAISAANGWNQFGTANNNVTANTLNQLMTGLTLTIPAGATYGIALDMTGATFPAYTNGAATTVTYSSGGCDIITGGNVGWGGPAAPGTPANNPRNFNGSVGFVANFAPCTSPARTVVVTVNQPTTLNAALPANQTICTDKVATFTANVTAGTGPHSYQWQVSSNGGGTYTNVTNTGVYNGATTATLTITAPPVSMSGYLYRCLVAGAAPCAAQTSRAATLTVNPLPVIVLTANPYTSLLPGLRTTISSVVSPNAAATYTWLRNGVAVSGATTGSINLDVDGLGDYQLRVTDINGCTNSSNIVTIKDSASGRCFIYPNPNSGQFQVRYYSVANNVLPRGIVVYDAKGDRVLSQNYTVGRPYDRMDVDLRAKGKGLYWVEIVDRNGNRLTMCRVVIQ